MSKKKTIWKVAGSIVAIVAVAAHILRKKAAKATYKAEVMEAIPVRKMGFYEKHVKPVMDTVCAGSAIIVFSPLYAVVALLVKFKLGSPVLFTQDRPGLIGSDGKETIFKMYKFRTMTDEKDEEGNLLPDDVRLTKFGAWLRSSSMEGNDIIRQTTKSLENKGFREVSPIHFFNGCNLISNDFRVMIA